MKTDTELEGLLRTTLANRAATVTDAPPVPADLPARRHRAWLPALAAAAAVAIAVAGVLVGIHLAKDNPPANPTPTPTPAPIPTTCPTTLPVAWRAAFTGSALATRGRSTQVLSIAPDGSVLALQDDGPVPGAGRFVVRLRPGRAPDVLYDVPDPDHQSVAIAQQYEHWLLIGLNDEERPPKGTIPGSSPIGLGRLLVVDLSNHTSHTLFAPDALFGGGAMNSAAIFDGQAYWDQRTGGFAARRGVVRAYDFATGVTRTVYHGQIGYTEVTANGLGLQIGEQHRVIVPAQLPAPVDRAVSSDERARLGTDGTAYAWTVSPRILGWWAPGEAAPTYRRLPKGMSIQDFVDPPLVAGQFVVTTSILTDMRTGASARLPTTTGGVTRPDFYLSRSGLLAGLGFTETAGHYIDGYWADAAMTVLRIDTTSLPPVTC